MEAIKQQGSARYNINFITNTTIAPSHSLNHMPTPCFMHDNLELERDLRFWLYLGGTCCFGNVTHIFLGYTPQSYGIGLHKVLQSQNTSV